MISWCRFNWGSKTFYLKIKPSVGKTALNLVSQCLKSDFFFNGVVLLGALAVPWYHRVVSSFCQQYFPPVVGLTKTTAENPLVWKRNFLNCSEIQSHWLWSDSDICGHPRSFKYFISTNLLAYTLSTCIWTGKVPTSFLRSRFWVRINKTIQPFQFIFAKSCRWVGCMIFKAENVKNK